MTVVLGGARTRISVAPPPVAAGGFLTAANVVDLTDGDHALMGAEYSTDACGAVTEWTAAWCVDPIPAQCTDPGAAANPKVFTEARQWVSGDPFTFYAGSACDIDTLEGRLASATAAFNYGERFGVDQAMAAWLTTVDTETSIAGDIDCALGQAENWLAANYGGVGLVALPIPAVVPALASGSLRRTDSGRIITALGTTVAAYIELGPAPMDAWVMGQLTLLRGPLKSYSVSPMVRSDGTCEPARALAERSYVPLVECAVGHFTVTCCDCAATP